MYSRNCPMIEILEMKQKLTEHENWNFHDLLPEEWIFKVVWEGFGEKSGSRLCFLTGDGFTFDTMKEGINHIKSNPSVYSHEDTEKCKAFLKQRNQEKVGDRFKWKVTDDLPTGWQIRPSEGKSSQLWIRSPRDGQQYRSRFCAIQDMIKKRQLYTKEEIEAMRQSMINHEYWIEDEQLPSQWLYKIIWEGKNIKCSKPQMNVTYLTREGAHYTSCRAAIQHMRQHSVYSSHDQDSLKKLSKSLANNLTQNRQDWIKDDETVPSGWKLRYSEGKSSQQWILSPNDGKQYRSRFSAIQDMIKNKDLYTEEEIEKMRELMVVHESWIKEERLPSNWLYKITWEGQHKSKQCQSNIIFLSSEGDYFGSFKTASEHMEKLNHYSEFNQENLRNLQTELHNNLTLSREDWVEDDETLPNGWMKRFANKWEYFLRPDGRQFKSRCVAYKL